MKSEEEVKEELDTTLENRKKLEKREGYIHIASWIECLEWVLGD